MKYILVLFYLSGEVHTIEKDNQQDCILAASFAINFEENIKTAGCRIAGEIV